MYICSTILPFSTWKTKYTKRCCNLLDCALATFPLNVFQWSSETYFWLSCVVEIKWYNILSNMHLHYNQVKEECLVSCNNVSALNVHFESQCIPTHLAWYAHHLPTWFLRFTTVIVNIIELVIPFLFFFPNRKVRIIAFYTQVNIFDQLSHNYLYYLMLNI